MAEVSGDHGEILSCVVLATTSECKGVDDSPSLNDTYRYRARLRHKLGREVADSKFGSAPEKWRADSGATYHMTRSPEFLTDIRSSDDKVRVGGNRLLAVEYYGSLTVVLGDSGIIELSDVANVS